MVPEAGTWLEEPTFTQGRYHSGVCLNFPVRDHDTEVRGQPGSERDAHRLVVMRTAVVQPLDGLRLLVLLSLYCVRREFNPDIVVWRNI